MSHLTTVKTSLTDHEAVKDYVQSEKMRAAGFRWEENGVVRYFGGARQQADYVIKCPGKYDIGIQANSDGSLTLLGDWGYADFYSHFGTNYRDKDIIATKILEGQNKYIFIREMKKKKYKIKEVTDPVTGKERIEASV